uniref:Phosphoglycerate mutase family protein n=1 Tax=Acrobeloides nanus TaxID=290746 RepID=A0A914D079_9BILA
MPKTLPQRKNPFITLRSDPPLTTLGYFHAKLAGEELLELGVKINHIYTSPTLRCIQTANAIIEALQIPNLKFNIEPGLLQWTRFCRGKIPIFMTSRECEKARYNINPNYQPIYLTERLSLTETMDDFYARSHEVVKMALRMTEGNVLFVGHGGTLFSCTTQLCGLPIPSEQEAYNQFINTQYLDCKEAQEQTDGLYMLNDSPILPFTCSGHRKNETL